MKMDKATISKRVEGNLAKLRHVHVKLPTGKNINIAGELTKIPRTGKSVRIDSFNLLLPKRSLLDHIITLARNADIFLSFSKIAFDQSKVADMIVFHDLAEVIIGDVPQNTSKQLASIYFMTQKEKDEQEKDANALIERHLTGALKVVFSRTLKSIEKVNTPEYAFFQMVDKIDPILAVWRYIFSFKENIDIDHFILAMSDYFTASDRIQYAINPEYLELMQFLLNKQNATRYYHEGNEIFKELHLKILNSQALCKLIEAVPMHFILNVSF